MSMNGVWNIEQIIKFDHDSSRGDAFERRPIRPVDSRRTFASGHSRQVIDSGTQHPAAIDAWLAEEGGIRRRSGLDAPARSDGR